VKTQSHKVIGMFDKLKRKGEKDSGEEQAFCDKSFMLLKMTASSIINCINPNMACVATILIYTTWILSGKYKKVRIENIQAHPIEVRPLIIKKKIEDVERVIAAKERALAESSPTDRRIHEHDIGLLKQYRDNLIEIYEYESIKYMAWKYITEFGSEKVVKELDKVVRKIEKGEEINRDAVRILEDLEKLQIKREKIKELLEKILKSTPTT